MKEIASALVALLGLASTAAGAQAPDRNVRVLAKTGGVNIAAAQVAVAQAQLFGSTLVAYRAGIDNRTPARVIIATRNERLTVDVDADTFAVRPVLRQRTRRALPRGMLICRSYAPIDAIVRSARQSHAGRYVEVFPPHRPNDSWKAQVGNSIHRVTFDGRGHPNFTRVSLR